MNPLDQEVASGVFSRDLIGGERLFSTGECGPVWQVINGMLRVEVDQPCGTGLIHLALAGDLVGAEAVLAHPYAFCVTAVIPSQLKMVNLDTDLHRERILSMAFSQAQEHAAGVMRLREGSVWQRLDHLLDLFQKATGEDIFVVRRKHLPQLREIAGIINVAPESVCRSLTQRLGQKSKTTPANSILRTDVMKLTERLR